METHIHGHVLPGTRIWLQSDPEDSSHNLTLRVAAGYDTRFNSNSVLVHSNHFERLDPALLTFAVFRSVLLAATEPLGATQGIVWPSDIASAGPTRAA